MGGSEPVRVVLESDCGDEGTEDCDDFNKACTGGETSGEGRTV